MIAKFFAFQKLSDDIGRPVMRPNVVNSENVWMIECRGGPSLLLEAIQPIRVGSKLSRENFDRHVTVKPPVTRAIDFAHAAFAEFRDDRVLSDRGVGGNGFDHAIGSLNSHFGASNFFTNASNRGSPRSGS